MDDDSAAVDERRWFVVAVLVDFLIMMSSYSTYSSAGSVDHSNNEARFPDDL